MPADPNLLKAARILLGLSQDDLANAVGISRKSLARVEAGGVDSTLGTVEAIKVALELRGVTFLGGSESFGPGLRVPADLASGWEAERARLALERGRSKTENEEP
ncbi:helix-turn-helix domain-containing protein [Aureimonas flava]|uniref:Helix-turn-helix domain-containing protein n=1 Tax=Aureimonas flava TaxID=2320271 RepID=A0A3A1WRR3_9HYPH|nr:helix-turn-helix domain-containing protein [Aureimonas flava]RIY03763.1 helix-turn-helix domain-containing protein [Aureimonas flava]